MSKFLNFVCCGCILQMIIFSLPRTTRAEDLSSVAAGLRMSYMSTKAGIDSRLSSGSANVDDSIRPELFMQIYPSQRLSIEYGLLFSDISFIWGKPPFRETGSSSLINQTLSAQIHLGNNYIDPYFGGGMNLVLTHDTKGTLPSLTIDDHLGWLIQTGIDLRLSKTAWINLDYRFIDVDTSIRTNGVPYKFDISPHVYSFGIKYRF